MSLEIINGGALTTVQDLGRFGYMDKGFQVSGAVDEDSMRLANLLVGNEQTEAVLEATVMGPTVRFDGPAVIALTGANMTPKLNGAAAPMDQAVAVQAGDVLTCGFAVSGCRGYVAFAGGLAIEPVLGSRSTNLKCALGGFKGRALKTGDRLDLRREISSLPHMEKRKADPLAGSFRTPADPDRTPVLRVVQGPQSEYFTEKGLQTLTQSVYAVTSDSNRMACKLSGEAVEFADGGDIISDGITTGSIQVSSGGMPMVMLADHQTTGGYAKIGTVISVDIPAIGQRKPGEKVRFSFVSVEEAQRLYAARKAYMEKLDKEING
ncbi:MAG: biotin-dependent carboxyltransferase family protein [Eubacteriales bacterium]|nr:biotin-dependent carboxyltransferase family protein [Eubacteriales bacterium]